MSGISVYFYLVDQLFYYFQKPGEPKFFTPAFLNPGQDQDTAQAQLEREKQQKAAEAATAVLSKKNLSQPGRI